MMLAERDPGIICTEAQNIQTSDLTNYISE